MAKINLPEKFKTKLEEDQKLDGIVKSTLFEYGEILDDNKLYFFSEYTDHGIKHIEKLLFSSNNLIPDKTFESVLKPNDIAYYILAVILHDLGMHLNLEGFKLLINGDFDDIRIKELDELTWAELWHDFLNEAKKFSGKQLKGIFGDENTVIKIPSIEDGSSITESNRKLIGEFLRRHHPRLAHEIGIKGFPGMPNILEFAIGLDLNIRNMIGLIARSHGVNLRTCLSYIEEVYGKNLRRVPYNTHAVYLMTLLRIADYLQMTSDRTSVTILKIRTFSSPISDHEHAAHLAVDSIDDKYQDDPERIYVTTSPMDSKMFLKLEKLINNIQYEFDVSWAVLGELYGNVNNRPELRYRRITSNLNDDNFKSRQSYIADSFSFKANDEIVRLLVGPLYGDSPSYGVRELLQNAIDACKEKQELIRRQEVLNYNPIVKVEITKREDGEYLIISDNGVGMDAATIKDYFLSAGASYRKNIDWQKQFVDDRGNVSVRKSGRFGIGILAAFLIGKEIYVETKKREDSFGFRFIADLFTDQINVLKDKQLAEGTRIRIKIVDEAFEKMKNWDSLTSSIPQWHQWFTLKSPEIQYIFHNEVIYVFPVKNPDVNEFLPNQWHAIEAPGFNKILWTYSNDYVRCNATCNGIVIPGHLGAAINLSPITTSPQVSIFDNNALTPLTISRNSFSAELPFNQLLKEDIFKDFIACLLMTSKLQQPKRSLLLGNQKLNYPGTRVDYENFSYGKNAYEIKNLYNNIRGFINSILISKKGFILNYDFFLRKLGKINAVLIQSEDSQITKTPIEINIRDRFLLFTNSKLNAIYDYKAAIDGNPTFAIPREMSFEEIYDDRVNEEFFSERIEVNARIYMKKERYRFLFKSSKKRMPQWLNEMCELQFEKHGWTCLHLDNPKKTIFSESFLKKYSRSINFLREYELECTSPGDEILDYLLNKYIGDDVVIPFNLNQRKEKYPLAFKELNRYMAKYL